MAELTFEERIKKYVDEITDFLVKKNQGYGNAFTDGMIQIKKTTNQIIPLKSKGSYMDKKLKYLYWVGFWQRLNDKIKRLLSLVFADGYDENEKLGKLTSDTKDIIGYGLLMLDFVENIIEKNK